MSTTNKIRYGDFEDEFSLLEKKSALMVASDMNDAEDNSPEEKKEVADQVDGGIGKSVAKKPRKGKAVSEGESDSVLMEFYLPSSLHRRLRMMAAYKGTKMSVLIREGIERQVAAFVKELKGFKSIDDLF